ncbi:2-(5-triphosphoribosyl)-3-dephospho-CoA synthase [Lactococcus piscium]|uniref:Probable 2-(5''-triphosphoribosyl)-3'-dephosphocoenzyme-A synthase n=1 Tax=Pseudolactococcus piscium TaxID=1364 RepID=A0A2A5RY96_9LACT|nr:triphosphoribosyl-dephospho-CoA synthase CitG [Lactococcus piscium]PCS06185.1 2-(5-triphosphoribosyl)-3-dephospho-CoA synthase [Lactococcus piscium]
MSIFAKGKPVSLPEILASKVARVARLKEVRQKFSDATIISITLNIPGNIKNSRQIQLIFRAGMRELTGVFMTQWEMTHLDLQTGPEAILVVDAAANTCKRKAVTFETDFVLGRLFDVDVLAADRKNLSRATLEMPCRTCYVCAEDAKVCARSQQHPWIEIRKALDAIYLDYVRQDKEKWVSSAIRAMLYEVSVTPKPGLVDPSSQGSHQDMDAFLFIDSAISLRPYFTALYEVSLSWTASLPSLFEEIRRLGIKAEITMLKTTEDVNTHKGVIFSLGILFSASVYQKQVSLDLQNIICQMLAGLTEQAFAGLPNKSTLTAGESQFLSYGLTGVRGEAEKGFPTVFDLALPYLKNRKGTMNDRLLDTLMLIATSIQDTNLIKRAGGIHVLDNLQEQVTHYFDLGGAKTTAGKAYMYQLDQVFIRQNLSLGGSADLLILTIFLELLTDAL